MSFIFGIISMVVAIFAVEFGIDLINAIIDNASSEWDQVDG